MTLDKIVFEIGYSQGFYYVKFEINQKTIFKYEFLDLFKNLLNLLEVGFVLQQEPLKYVHYFILDDYSHEFKFKVSPNPPMDWLVLGLPTKDNVDKFHFDRLVFCEALKSSIVEFMRDQNMDYLGNPNMPKNLKGYGDEIWKVIGHEWF